MVTSDLSTRAAAGAAMAAVALAAVWAGGLALWALLAAVVLGMVAEWSALVHAPRGKIALALAGAAFGIALALPDVWGADRATVAALVGLAFVVGLIGNSGGLGFGLCYAGIPAVAILYLRGEPQGILLSGWTLAIVWATDIGAYFAGRRFGGPLLAPRLSPKKTWSGLAGGAIAATAIGAAIAFAAGLPGAFHWIAAPLALLAQAGDLFESWLKRRANVKDSGHLLPGHGGLLDRLDGAVPVATLVGALVAGGALAA